MTCPATGACLTCRIAGLSTCPFRQTCGPNLPLCFGEVPKVTWKKVTNTDKVIWDGRFGYWSGTTQWPK